eukprot:1138156-Pelagomonas_calceolata.AAC.2
MLLLLPRYFPCLRRLLPLASKHMPLNNLPHPLVTTRPLITPLIPTHPSLSDEMKSKGTKAHQFGCPKAQRYTGLDVQRHNQLGCPKAQRHTRCIAQGLPPQIAEPPHSISVFGYVGSP